MEEIKKYYLNKRSILAISIIIIIFSYITINETYYKPEFKEKVKILQQDYSNLKNTMIKQQSAINNIENNIIPVIKQKEYNLEKRIIKLENK